ncbi:hypothetical protein [Acidaminococcus intestini]|uniref:Uncharacterized protein n=1 Tax=Acidaminococcus intestini (strain RyC-MR95) TaxID=568816 RepID=G4Q3W5_ACIIR|nr:hypothetical protein [Acidaminococcus intestini]AEQ23031.1 hypothetical protein Acin_1820 [Acidaminococcus intestini RyC-MR95]
MNLTLSEAIALLTFTGGILLWVIHSMIEPLKVLLDRTVQALNRLDTTLKEERERREAIGLRLQAVDSRSKSNSHRLDVLEEQQRKCLTG